MSMGCREKPDMESRLKAVDLYKTLQRSVQEKEGFANDQNAIVLRMLADSLEAVEQYGMLPPFLLPSCKYVHCLLVYASGCNSKFDCNSRLPVAIL